MLFSESVGLELGAQSGSFLEVEEEVICSDAQLLCLSEEEEDGGPVNPFTGPQDAPYDDDDETQVPLSAAYHTEESSQEEELLEEGVIDDEVLDPSWCEQRESGGSSSEEEIAPTVQKQQAQRGSRARGRNLLPAASTSAPGRSRAIVVKGCS